MWGRPSICGGALSYVEPLSYEEPLSCDEPLSYDGNLSYEEPLSYGHHQLLLFTTHDGNDHVSANTGHHVRLGTVCHVWHAQRPLAAATTAATGQKVAWGRYVPHLLRLAHPTG